MVSLNVLSMLQMLAFLGHPLNRDAGGHGGVYECQGAKEHQWKIWGIFWRSPTSVNCIAYKEAGAEAGRVRCGGQRESWMNCISNISSGPSSGILWKRVKDCMGLYSENRVSILKHNNRAMAGPKGIAETMASALTSNSSSDSCRSYSRLIGDKWRLPALVLILVTLMIVIVLSLFLSSLDVYKVVCCLLQVVTALLASC